VPQKRIEILGVPVDCLDWQLTLEIIEKDLVSCERQQAVIAVNPEKVIRAQRSPELLDYLRRASLLIPDGIGIVVAARLLGLGRMERIAGSELMPKICEIAARRGCGVYVFGAAPSINEKAAQTLRQVYPTLKVVGRHHGYVSESDMDRIIADINASGAMILFLALGSPRQELWMARYLSQTHVRLCQGIGGTLDVLAGSVRRAPAAFIRLHLEWLYRLLSQPRRLLRQSALPNFALQVLSAALAGGQKSGTASGSGGQT
jgi:N-acetylglucosaminyldiphosphoundecaprenol N-acetyl-beta-D-mannosaminyltransferase